MPDQLREWKEKGYCEKYSEEAYRVANAFQENCPQARCARDRQLPPCGIRAHQFSHPKGQHIISEEPDHHRTKQLCGCRRFDWFHQFGPTIGAQKETCCVNGEPG